MRAAFLVVVALLASGPVLASSESEIRDRLEQWRQDFNAGRSDRVCDLFAPDLVSSYQGRADLDHAGVCSQLQRALAVAGRSLSYELAIQDVLVDGDLAAVRLVWTFEVAVPGLAAERSRDQGLDIFRRQPDGVWRIVRFIAYPLPAIDP